MMHKTEALLEASLVPGDAAWDTRARRYKGKLRYAFVSRQLDGVLVKGHALTAEAAEELAIKYARKG